MIKIKKSIDVFGVKLRRGHEIYYPKDLTNTGSGIITIVAVNKETNTRVDIPYVPFIPSLNTVSVIKFLDELCRLNTGHKSYYKYLDAENERLFNKNSKEKLYYIQNGYVGNSVLWWAINSEGYTTEIEKAGKFSKDEVQRAIKDKPDNKGWLCSHVDNNEKAHKLIIDSQYLNPKYSIRKKKKVGRKPSPAKIQAEIVERLHANHCCKECGCKYGDNNCPVVKGRVKQLYSCHNCN